MHHQIIVREESQGLRIDKFLSSKLTGITRSKIQDSIKNKQMFINNVLCNDCAYLVKVGDIIKIDIVLTEKPQFKPADISLEVVFEDEYLAVINKPPGLVVHPGAGNYDNTLANGLAYYFGRNLSQGSSPDRPGIVHRLDKDTSGLILIAKDDNTHSMLSERIARREIERLYYALVWGVPSPLEGTIEANITRHKHARTKMITTQVGGKHAVTHYKTLEIFKGMFSLVECRLQTGRTHQIRVHMNHIGHSIVGDQTYGKNDKKINYKITEPYNKEISTFKRQALHAFKLSFVHPITMEFLEFSSEIASDMSQLINYLRLNYKS